MPIKIIFGIIIFLFAVNSSSYGEGVSALKELDKSQAEIRKDLAQETEVFNSLEKAITGGTVKKGASKKEIVKKVGEPVVVIEDSEGYMGREKWVYKPASSSFFKGAKIYLFFDKFGILDDIEIIK